MALILGAGLFALLMLVAASMLAIAYTGSQLVVENERNQLRIQSGAISSLVTQSYLSSLKHVVDLTSEDTTFNSFKTKEAIENQTSFLTGVFYTQRENTIGMLALLSDEGEFLVELNTEIFEFPNVKKDISSSIHKPGNWRWSVQEGQEGKPAVALIYYSREILNNLTGKVIGFLVGGIFVNNNQEYVREIQTHSGAEFAALVWNENVLAISGVAPEGLVGPDAKINKDQFLKRSDAGTLFSSKSMTKELADSEFSTVVSYTSAGERSLEQFYLISALLGLFLTLFLSIVAAYAGRHFLLKPIHDLIAYARKAERQDTNLKLPQSYISEFNEVGRNLENVLAAFQESEKRFQDYISVSSDSVWETDENDQYVLLSRDALSENKTDLGKIIGKKRWDVVGVDLEYGDWKGHLEAIANRQAFRNFVFRRMNSEGSLVYWSASGMPRYDKDGNYRGYRGTSTDITKEIASLQEAEDTQEKLRQSQKMEIVGQLTGGVAHDFNNLLSIIMGNLELIEDHGSFGKEIDKFLADAVRGAEKGAALTHQLLAYSRQQTLRPDTVQPSNVIWDMTSLLEQALGASINFKTNLKDTWPVFIDPAELENAILNLVINARDAMPGGGQLMIESFDIHLDQEYADTVPELNPGDYVSMIVSDTGEGIEKGVIDRILEPFFTTKEVGKGSGLGLSMVFGFVKQSGGHITVYSEVGQGTSIQLYLPRATGEKDVDLQEQLSEIQYGNGELVLVVEDNVQVRQLVVSQLTSIGYTTMECADGPMALSILEKEPVDILLSDVILPLGMNGLEIIGIAEEQYPDMPKLMMSGFTGDAIRYRENVPQDIEILYKPFTKLRLSTALDNAKKRS